MIRAMVFDLDGTLVQTEKFKALSYAKAAAMLRPELEKSLVVEAFKEVVGRSRREVAQHLLARFRLEETAESWMEHYTVDAPWQAYVQLRLEVYERMLGDGRMVREHQWPHNMELLRRARAACSKVGLATMSHCRQAQRILWILGLSGSFDFVASRDDVERGKPDPEIYLLVAKELDVPPAECLAIEDSPTGVRAALAAGMRCVAVSTPFTRSGLHADGLLDERWIVDDPARLLDVVDEIIEEEAARARTRLVPQARTRSDHTEDV